MPTRPKRKYVRNTTTQLSACCTKCNYAEALLRRKCHSAQSAPTPKRNYVRIANSPTGQIARNVTMHEAQTFSTYKRLVHNPP